MAAQAQLSIFDAEFCALDSPEVMPQAAALNTGIRDIPRSAAQPALVIHTKCMPVNALPMKMRSE